MAKKLIAAVVATMSELDREVDAIAAIVTPMTPAVFGQATKVVYTVKGGDIRRFVWFTNYAQKANAITGEYILNRRAIKDVEACLAKDIANGWVPILSADIC